VAFSTVLGSTIVTQLDGLELVVRGAAPGPFTWCSP
jgi:hypothetical protein